MPVITLDTFTFEHILEWEETQSRTIARKRVIGRVKSHTEPEVFVSMPLEIKIRARVNSTERTALRSVYNEAAWQELKEDGSLLYYVWVEKPLFRWDSGLGCGERQWVAEVLLICSNS